MTKDIPHDLEQGALGIAYDCAKWLTGFNLVANDPFEELARAEVCARLESDFYLIRNPMPAHGVMSRGEAIFVIGESMNAGKVIGFATCKPRFPDFSSASIGFIAVDQNFRRQGVMRLIMEDLLRHHPALGLDCGIELVSMYQKFGFYVTNSQGSHIGMETAPLNGQMFTMDAHDLLAEPSARAAMARIKRTLGSDYEGALQAFNARIKSGNVKAANYAGQEVAKHQALRP